MSKKVQAKGKKSKIISDFLVPTIIDNSVEFAFPLPRNSAFAWDDFAPTSAQLPNPNFLQGLASGTGFSAAWQAQNWNATTYSDG